MRSDIWDYKKQQGELLMKYFSVKYIEEIDMHLQQLNGLKNMNSIPEQKLLKMISECNDSRQKALQVKNEISVIVDEDMWTDSLTCLGCLHSFKNRSDLLEHLRKHLVKLGMLPSRKDLK